MISSNFFPTSIAVIDRMMNPLMKEYDNERYIPHTTHILEPSAGKGDILDRLVERYNAKKQHIACCELDPELQMILTGKGYRVINDDFLEYCDPYLFDLIVMNPPFENGDEHLLKAWDTLQSGQIACILNAETILNPHTEKRKLLCRIIEQYGRYEVIGPAFKNAERATDVNCAIVWLKKERKETPVDFGKGFDLDSSFDDPKFTANPLAHRNIIESLVSQYQSASQAMIEFYRSHSRFEFFVQGVMDKHDIRLNRTLNEQIDDLKAHFWKYVFDKTKLGQVTTSGFQRKFDEYQKQTASMGFTVANIMKLLEIFFLNSDQFMQDCILEVFDTATKFHEKNIIHTEGWKHNKSWKIAPKIILPYGIENDWNWHLGYSWRNAREFYGDVDKALCFITGEKLTEINTLVKAIEQQCERINKGEVVFSDKFSSSFFDVRLYKKGTVHLTFRDKGLLAKFNQAAAEGKHWIGAGY